MAKGMDLLPHQTGTLIDPDPRRSFQELCSEADLAEAWRREKSIPQATIDAERTEDIELLARAKASISTCQPEPE